MADEAYRQQLIAQAKEKYRQQLIAEAKARSQNQLAGSVSPADTGEPEQAPSAFDNVKAVGKAGLKYAGKALDYGGGVVRTAGAYPFVKQVTGQDVLNAFKANPLTGDQIFEKAGVPQGGSLSDIAPSIYGGSHWFSPQKGGMLDPTARGAAGFALETATDPLVLGSIGAKSMANAAAKSGRPLTNAEKLLQYTTRPVGTALEDAGKSMYQSGFKRVDAVADKFNKMPASEVLFNRGVTGTNRQIAKKTDAILDGLREQQADILAKVDAAVPLADVDKALQPLRDRITNFRGSKDPMKIEAANALEDDLKTYEALKSKPAQTIQEQVPSSILDERGNPMMNTVTKEIPAVEGPSASELSGMKSSVQNSVPQKAYQSGVVQGNQFYTQGRKSLGQGLRGETERVADLAAPELGDSLRKTNAEMGSLLSTGNTLDQEAMKGANKNLLTSVDPIVMGLGHDPAIMAAKKAADLSKTTWFRTKAGMNLYDLGNYGDVFLRRPSIWNDLAQKYNIPQEEEQ